MKHFYCYGGLSIVTLRVPTWSFEGPALITFIHTRPGCRGRGYARLVMSEVLEDADNEGYTLVISVQPDGKLGSLSFDLLKAWYERLGFKMLDDERTMQRKPV